MTDDPARAIAEQRTAEDFLDLMNEADEHWHADQELAQLLSAANAAGRQAGLEEAAQIAADVPGVLTADAYTMRRKLVDAILLRARAAEGGTT